MKWLLAVCCLAFAGCGGGGGSAPAVAVAPANPNAFPTASPSSGDYFVYTLTTTPSLPAGSAASQRSMTRYFKVVNPDSSLTRIQTYSNQTSSGTWTFNAEGGLETSILGATTCRYAPAWVGGLPKTAMVGDSFSTSTSETCTSSGSASTTSALTNKGTADAIESVTIPLGTFRAFKYTHTTVSSSSATTTSTVESCWSDMVTGRTVKCEWTYSTTNASQSSPASSGTASMVLQAYSFRGAAPVGPAVRRFAGYWNVTFSGSSGSGKCDNLLIDTNGSISGSCVTVVVGGYSAPWSVTGAVDINGNASITAATGATLTGNFASPINATGTWINGAASGTWAAAHI